MSQTQWRYRGAMMRFSAVVGAALALASCGALALLAAAQTAAAQTATNDERAYVADELCRD